MHNIYHIILPNKSRGFGQGDAWFPAGVHAAC